MKVFLKGIKILSLAVLLTEFILFYFSGNLVFAQPIINVPRDTGTNTSSVEGRATYKGVDQSITDFLCTPTQPAPTQPPKNTFLIRTVFAQDEDENTDPNARGGPPSVGPLGTSPVLGQDLYNCINKLYRFGIAFGAVAGVFFIVLAGYYYISGSEAAISKAKTTVGGVIIGLLIMLTSFILLKQINPDLVRFRPIQPPEVSDPCPQGLGSGACQFPSCEQMGLANQVCTDQNGNTTVSNGQGGAIGSAQSCSLGPKQEKAGFGTCSQNGVASCPDCVKVEGTSWYAAATLANLINTQIIPDLKSKNISYNFNEGFCPKAAHASCAHFNGHAIDMGTTNATELNKVCQVLNKYLAHTGKMGSATRGAYIFEGGSKYEGSHPDCPPITTKNGKPVGTGLHLQN